MNICFPYSENFCSQVEEYQRMYQPKVTIIHSTVPVGTSRKLNALHSPVHGKHPNLAPGIRTFKKYLGGADQTMVKYVARYYRAARLRYKIVSSPEASELSKICCTTRLGWDVVFMKWVEELSEKYRVPFDEVYGWVKYYNIGYRTLNMTKYTRPMLSPIPGKIAGHCVIPNCRMLPDEEIPQFILRKNDQYTETAS